MDASPPERNDPGPAGGHQGVTPMASTMEAPAHAGASSPRPLVGYWACRTREGCDWDSYMDAVQVGTVVRIDRGGAMWIGAVPLGTWNRAALEAFFEPCDFNASPEVAFVGIPPGSGDTPPTEQVTFPNHYGRFKIEPIYFAAENKLDFFQSNVVKYVCRHDAKNGDEDLAKAIRYLVMYRRFLLGDPDWAASAPQIEAAFQELLPDAPR